MKTPRGMTWWMALAVTCSECPAASEQDALVLLSNPLSDLNRFAANLDFDNDLGPQGDTERQTLSMEPTLSVHLSGDWRMVSRTRLPLIDTHEHSGLGDLHETLLFTSSKGNAITWAVGGAVRLDTASDEELGAGGWSAGPAVALVQRDGSEVSGILATRLWGGEPGVGNVWRIEGFTTWNRDGHGVSLALEAEHDSLTQETTCPISIGISRVVRSGAVFVNIGARARYFLDVPMDKGPWGLGITFAIVHDFDAR